MNEPQLSTGIEKALKKVSPEIAMEARRGLAEFLEFSKQQPECQGENPWREGEKIAFIAGFIAGRGNKIIRSN